jgi:cytochrome c oxidase subunit 2
MPSTSLTDRPPRLAVGARVEVLALGVNGMPIFEGRKIAFAASAFFAASGSALAGEGQPSPWQMGFQKAATPIMEQITAFHDYVNVIIVLIALFVLALLVYVMVRFNERRQPQSTRTTHNTALEVIWTVVPVVILVAIAIPSFRLLYAQYDFPKADLTITATGNQWFWSYEYPDTEGVSFDSYPKADKDLGPDEPRLLTTDTAVVVPVDKTVRLIITANDVIHAWTIPAFGMKIDAIPGRLNEDWFRATKEGVFYGECSELCGKDHSFMPIMVRVVSQADYDAWLAKAKRAVIEEANNMFAAKAAPAGGTQSVAQR